MGVSRLDPPGMMGLAERPSVGLQAEPPAFVKPSCAARPTRSPGQQRQTVPTHLVVAEQVAATERGQRAHLPLLDPSTLRLDTSLPIADLFADFLSVLPALVGVGIAVFLMWMFTDDE